MASANMDLGRSPGQSNVIVFGLAQMEFIGVVDGGEREKIEEVTALNGGLVHLVGLLGLFNRVF